MSACSLSMRPDFIALVDTHLAGEPSQIHLATGYVVAALVMTILAPAVGFCCCAEITFW